jgi:hypothetical protein
VTHFSHKPSAPAAFIGKMDKKQANGSNISRIVKATYLYRNIAAVATNVTTATRPKIIVKNKAAKLLAIVKKYAEIGLPETLVLKAVPSEFHASDGTVLIKALVTAFEALTKSIAIKKEKLMSRATIMNLGKISLPKLLRSIVPKAIATSPITNK